MSEISLCIPTYNRATQLSRSLKHILESVRLRGFDDKVRVCVSDNGSDDETPDVLKTLQRDYSNLYYRRSQTNLGFGVNLWNVVKFAETKFVILAGDDDLVDVDALLSVYSILETQDLDLLLLNSAPGHCVTDAYLRKCVSPLRKISRLDQYLNELGAFHASFIGNLAFCRESFLETPEGDYVSSSAYPHMVPVMNCLVDKTTFFANLKIVDPDDSHRGWRRLQSIYTSIDMAQIYSTFGMTTQKCSMVTRWKLLFLFAKSLPRAWRLTLFGSFKPDRTNPFETTNLRNVLDIYSRLIFLNSPFAARAQARVRR